MADIPHTLEDIKKMAAAIEALAQKDLAHESSDLRINAREREILQGEKTQDIALASKVHHITDMIRKLSDPNQRLWLQTPQGKAAILEAIKYLEGLIIHLNTRLTFEREQVNLARQLLNEHVADSSQISAMISGLNGLVHSSGIRDLAQRPAA